MPFRGYKFSCRDSRIRVFHLPISRIIKTNDTLVAPARAGAGAAPAGNQAVVADSRSRAAPIGSGTAGAYQCYQCNSATVGEEDCPSTDIDVLAPFLKVCPPLPKGSTLTNATTAVQCRKIQQNIEGEENRIIRECAYTGDEELDGKKRTGNKGVITYFYTCYNGEDVSFFASASEVGYRAVLSNFEHSNRIRTEFEPNLI